MILEVRVSLVSLVALVHVVPVRHGDVIQSFVHGACLGVLELAKVLVLAWVHQIRFVLELVVWHATHGVVS